VGQSTLSSTPRSGIYIFFLLLPQENLGVSFDEVGGVWGRDFYSTPRSGNPIFFPLVFPAPPNGVGLVWDWCGIERS